MSYFTWITFIRIFLSAFLVAAIWSETGPYTAAAIALITVALEGLSYSVRLLAIDKLESFNAYTKSLLKKNNSDKIDEP